MQEKDLNPQQQKAVSQIEGSTLVLAGAGAGKTRVITHRVAKLLEQGVLPQDILAVTFTNKAAAEMRQRIYSLKQKFILACTFHSLGAKILRESIHYLGYSNQFTIYDEDDSEKLLKSCLQSLHIKEEKKQVKHLRHVISQAKNAVIDEEDSSSFAQQEELFCRVYPLYQERLKECNAVDFDDLLFLPNKLFTQEPLVRKEYQNRWLFVLVDEYQDTNHAQYLLTKTLVAQHQNLFAVGDPDQSIYSWRGAQYQNILQFQKDFLQATVITLEQNYRSTNCILQASNAVIAHNENRFEKNLWSAKEQGEKICCYFAENEQREAHYIVENILHLQRQQNIPLQEMAIFYRTNAQSRSFEDTLLRNRIPYQIIGGISFYQRKEIKDIMAFLRLCLSNSDFLSFTRTLPILTKGIGATTSKRLLEEAEKHKLAILDFVEKALEQPLVRLQQKQKQALASYLEIIHQMRKLLTSSTHMKSLIEEVLHITHYFTYLEQDPDSMEDRKQNIEALLAKAVEWEEQQDHPTLFTFLEELSLQSNPQKEAQDALRLMTLHNSKGLEFQAVFIAGLEEDLLPHTNSKSDPQQLEEERRLFYVGMTRAKEHLLITSSSYRYLWGQPKVMMPSRFLQEIPEKYTDIRDERSTFTAPIAEENHGLMQVGSRVKHQEFGQGYIQKSYHTSYGPTYDVFFEKDQITRSLVAKYAKLEPYFR